MGLNTASKSEFITRKKVEKIFEFDCVLLKPDGYSFSLEKVSNVRIETMLVLLESPSPSHNKRIFPFTKEFAEECLVNSA